MKKLPKWSGLAALAGLALASTIQAQVVSGRPFPNTYNFINPNPYIGPGMKLNQWAYNTTVVGKTYAQFPPWFYGYNPYPQVANDGPVYQPSYRPPLYSPPYAPPYTGGGYGPGGLPSPADPYAGGYSSGGYSPTAGYDPYNPYASYSDPYGGYLRGQADVMRSYGQLAMNLEQARLARELVNQAKLETKKKTLELQNWIRDNTLTYTQEQERIAAMTLKRVLSSATQSEIWSGKAQNLLLKDLAKNAKKGAVQPITLEEDVIKQLNVTTSTGNLGLVRNDGNLTFPAGIRELGQDKEFSDLLQAITRQTRQAFRQAIDANKPDGKLVRDLRADANRLRDQLAAKVNEIPIPQTLEAKRFLNDFEDALTALEKGDAAVCYNLQKSMSGPGKTVQELVDYMIRQGLRFAPATFGDEGAYQAVQSALAAYDLALTGSNFKE